MRDPLTWSIPLVRLFGITVRVHVLFPLIALGIILRVAFMKGPPTPPQDLWKEAAIVVGLLFVAVLLHEFGHCFGARLVDGDAHEVLLWPLGGLAAVDVPHTPRAHFLTTAAGPLVNLLLCLGTGCALAASPVRPPLEPWWYPFQRYSKADPPAVLNPELVHWNGVKLADAELDAESGVVRWWVVQLARFFWINWGLFLLNVLLPGFPMDGGRLFQCILWPRLGFREATRLAIGAGFITMLIVGVIAIIWNEMLLLLLALFIYVTCRQQYILLETGGEESLFGYDFSQGYTSLERDQPAARRRPGFIKRWLQKRAALRLQREQETRESEERRMDILLEKVQREGLHALSDEERRFLTRVSARYRNRQ
jgi:stage IV sporulation protein FB